MSHKVGVSGVHQDDVDSDSVLLLVLRPLSKSPRMHQGQTPSASGMWAFAVSRGLPFT